MLIAWLQDNIDCESGIIFDNDEDKTDSAALLPCIEQARGSQVLSFCALSLIPSVIPFRYQKGLRV
ncbi:hypothetical protein OHD55_09040 [Escherichia coli]|nr:hypothetical protein [Escherichia coli]